MIATILHQDVSQLRQHIHGRVGGVDVVDQVFAVKFQKRLGLVIVGFQTLLDHLLVSIVKTVVAQGPTLQALDQLGSVRAGQMKNPAHAQDVTEQMGLIDIPRNAVQQQKIMVGVKRVRLDNLVDSQLPQLDRQVVGHQFAPAGVGEKLLAKRRAQVERAEHVPARTVVIAGDRAERFALGAFPATRGTEEKIGLIFAHWG
jgi:hypothetical protein